MTFKNQGDFAKAFDKVPHHGLLHKLDFCGVREFTLRWIESFLRQRKKSVLLEGTKSTEADVLSGVPQGTVLDPYFSWPLLTTCQSPQNTQMPDYLLTTACSTDMLHQV